MSPRPMLRAAGIALFIAAGLAGAPAMRPGRASSDPVAVPLGFENPYRSCGLNCLYAISRIKGLHVSMKEIEGALSPRQDGDSTLADLERAARQIGLDSIAARVDLATLAHSPFPSIVQLKSPAPGSSSSHYVVCLGLHRDGVALLDPPNAATIHPYGEFKAEWTGVVVAFPADRGRREEFEARLGTSPGQVPWVLGLAGFAGVALAFVPIGRRSPRIGVALLLCATLGCGDGKKSPRLVIGRNPLDLGVLELGSSSFEVDVDNPGNAPLVVAGVASSCSCTSADQSLVVPPRRSGKLRGTVAVKSGPGFAELQISSNDPEEKPRTVRLVWAGKGIPTLSPDSIHLVGVAGESIARDLEVSYPSSEEPAPLNFLGIDRFPDGVELALIHDDPTAIRATPGLATSPNISPSPMVGKAQFRLKVTIPPSQGRRPMSGVVRVKHRGFLHELPLTLSVETNLGVHSSPELLLFSGGSMEALRAIERRSIIVSNDPGDRVELERAAPYLEVSLQASPQDPKSTSLFAKIISPPPIGSSRGEIILRTTSGKRVVIPVLASYEP